MMQKKIKVAISACLLGEHVRYDGQEKKHSILMKHFLSQYSSQLECLSFCPEVGIGMGVPREKIQLELDKQGSVRVLGVDDKAIDVSQQISDYAQSFNRMHPDINYYIVKSKSPSCGFQSTPLYKYRQNKIQQASHALFEKDVSGFFVHSLQAIRPDIHFISDTQLKSAHDCSQLFEKMKNSC